MGFHIAFSPKGRRRGKREETMLPTLGPSLMLVLRKTPLPPCIGKAATPQQTATAKAKMSGIHSQKKNKVIQRSTFSSREEFEDRQLKSLRIFWFRKYIPLAHIDISFKWRQNVSGVLPWVSVCLYLLFHTRTDFPWKHPLMCFHPFRVGEVRTDLKPKQRIHSACAISTVWHRIFQSSIPVPPGLLLAC